MRICVLALLASQDAGSGAHPWLDGIADRLAAVRVETSAGRWAEAEAAARALSDEVDAGRAAWSDDLETARERNHLAGIVLHVRALRSAVEARAAEVVLYEAGLCRGEVDAVRHAHRDR
jgi:hypothetical protein